MNTNDAGRYGVLRLLKKNEVDTVVASYPIDEEEVTFGRDPDCSVRLYYPTVSGIHAKIIFQERKAFLVVLGAHGLLIDNCPAFPAPSSDYPTTIPVSNNSEIEIHKKRFKFEYPPKALRTILLATPSPSKGKAGRRRTLRMSMIQSAHVFSPGPDPDPRVNLRVLQTPIRPLGSPLKARMQQEADGDEDEEASIVLVDGNHPRVVEEDKDLVILEDVEVQEPTPQVQPLNIKKHASMGSATPGRSRLASGSYAAPVPSLPVNRPQQQFQTPRRKPPRSSLHRAVLIRSAQRAVMRVEVEEEKEEQEVEETVNAADVAIVEEQSGFEEQEEEDAMDEDQQEEYEEELGDEDGDTREEDREVGPISSLRKSLEAVKNTWQAFRSRSRSPEKADRQEQDIADVCAFVLRRLC
ncbi:hypothetical protein BV25DRAFT_643580 [Artomyces pyxidatus]|uniref:Uncharacterized protein n=1 Tax=Artomyces pyxidatus TaxID=48021 RepID=A0ACB8T240_9AGAM|nr:hypothetical protein BV25DRAFT_643580 [Artomyces pyxidatus]